jgi:hypothetical protein
MGQILHGCATTTEAVRRAIQNCQESLRGLAKRYGINQKTVAKWKQRETVADLPTGPKRATSTLLSIEEEAIIVAFRRHTLLSLDDCLYALQPTIPQAERQTIGATVGKISASLPVMEERLNIRKTLYEHTTGSKAGALHFFPPSTSRDRAFPSRPSHNRACSVCCSCHGTIPIRPLCAIARGRILAPPG